MSAVVRRSAAFAQPARSPRRRDHLRLVPPPRPRHRRRLPLPGFLLVTLAVLGSGLGGLITVNTSAAQGAFRLAHLQAAASRLAEQERAAQAAAIGAAAPQRLAAEARRLGLRPATAVRYLRLPAGASAFPAKAAGRPGGGHAAVQAAATQKRDLVSGLAATGPGRTACRLTRSPGCGGRARP